MKKRKIISCILAFAMMCVTFVPAFANGQSTPIEATIEASTLSVTVPTSLPISFGADGESKTEMSATITNNSVAQVVIADIRVDVANGWTLVPWDTDWQDDGLGAKEYAFMINNEEVSTDGSVDASNFEAINGSGGTLEFTYNGRMAPQNESRNVTIGSVVFTFDWKQPDIISFNVRQSEYTETKTFEAEEGMTWAEWVESDYNTSEVDVGANIVSIYINNNIVYYDGQTNTYHLVDNANDETQRSDFVINEGALYTWPRQSGGGA